MRVASLAPAVIFVYLPHPNTMAWGSSVVNVIGGWMARTPVKVDSTSEGWVEITALAQCTIWHLMRLTLSTLCFFASSNNNTEIKIAQTESSPNAVCKLYAIYNF